MRSIFKKSQKGQHAFSLPKEDKAWDHYSPLDSLKRAFIPLPELSELDLLRHFIALSRENVGIDNTFIPLGSCTMKYNPKVNEWAAAQPGFSKVHPLAPDDAVQGCLKLIHSLLEFLLQLTGMHAGSLAPNAGAQGEFAGVKLIAAYHKDRKDFKRRKFLIPDSAHGTNPATVALAGFEVISIKTDSEGDLDLEDLKNHLSDETAGLLLTNPNTLGLFSPKILQICDEVHKAGGLLYYDGANLNPIMEIAKPGMMGFDVMHLNLHKTFSTPHGGGGPGSGPVLCNEILAPFLPLPRVEKSEMGYKSIWQNGKTIGHLSTFFGNFGIYLRAYLYAILHGSYGLRKVSEQAILNANYLKSKIGRHLKIPFQKPCMHEFVAQAEPSKNGGVTALDIAKRILDYGFYAPTIYFPLTVKECFLIEPTETESKETLDKFADAIEQIIKEISKERELLKSAPSRTTVKRLDEVKAAREPVLIDFLTTEEKA